MDCDVLLLAEVSEKIALPGYSLHATELAMAARRRWAAVATRDPMRVLPDPHGASAMAAVGDLRICSSILPWKGSGARVPWTGGNTAERTASAVAAVESATPTLWRGDWNHALSGREWAGSLEGRRRILDAVERLSLQVPTGDAAHQIDGLLSIDHIAVPASWTVLAVEHHPAFVDDVRISDHDAYVVEVSQG
jgi:hypothetical protein